jgi:hypothetical protein
MAANQRKLIRVMFDVLDETKKSLTLDKDLSIVARDPDEAIDFVFAEMQREFKRSDIRLSRVRICA